MRAGTQADIGREDDALTVLPPLSPIEFHR